jgi:hypothetical protein
MLEKEKFLQIPKNIHHLIKRRVPKYVTFE